MNRLLMCESPESLGCAEGDFTECWTLALTIQDLDQKYMPLLMEITSQHSFPSRGASISGQSKSQAFASVNPIFVLFL